MISKRLISAFGMAALCGFSAPASGADILTHLFALKDGEAADNVGGNLGTSLHVGREDENTVVWLTFQTGGADLSQTSGSNLTLYVDSVQTAGTLKVYVLDSALSLDEMDVEAGDLYYDTLSVVASIALSSAHNGKLIRLDMGNTLAGTAFHGLIIKGSGGLQVSLGSKDSDIPPMIELKNAYATPSQVSNAVSAATAAEAAAENAADAATAAAGSASSASASATSAAGSASGASASATSAAGSASGASASATSAAGSASSSSTSAGSASASAASASASAASAASSAGSASSDAAAASSSATAAAASAATADALFMAGGRFLSTSVPSGFSATGLRWNAETFTAGLADMSLSRYYIGGASANGKLFVSGGYNGSYQSALHAYSPSSNSWAALTGLPVNMHLHGMATVGGYIYAIGGWRSGSTLNANNYRCDTAGGTWTTMTAMPTARAASAVVAFGNKIYVIGGTTNSAGTAVTDANEVYNPATDTWTSKTALPTARAFMGACAAGGKIHVIGGAAGSASLSSHSVYDTSTNSWSSAAPLPYGLYYHQIVEVGGKIYAIGGAKTWASSTTESAVLQYDLDADAWFPLTQTMTTPRFGFGVGVIGGKIYIAGGHSGSGALAKTEAYTPPTTFYIVEKN